MMNDEMTIVRQYSADLPVKVQELIQALGIAYCEEQMPPENSGRIDVGDPFTTITVNANEGLQRRRFTAAHELGHYLLHRDLLEGRGHLDRLYSQGGNANPNTPLSPSHEVQANQFAANLLMPAGELRRRYNARIDNVEELADLCIVSKAAMEIRLKSLGIKPS